MNDLNKLSATIAKAPREGDEIVWRFKDNKGWRRGIVRSVMSGYTIIEVQEGAWPVDRVALEDIDWRRK